MNPVHPGPSRGARRDEVTSGSSTALGRNRGRQRWFLVLALLATASLAGLRARPGGTLQVALVSPAASVEPLTATAPIDAFRLFLTHQPLCRVVDFTRPAPNLLRLTPHRAIPASRVVEALERPRLLSTSPLTAGIADTSLKGPLVELTLVHGGVDLERILCHPVFAVPIGPFRAAGARLEANDAQPAGRPYLDAVVLQSADARTAERLLAQRRVQAVVGLPTAEDVPQLFATALVLGQPNPALRAALDSTVDRADLARFFVPAPSGPLEGLLPPSLAPAAAVAKPARPAPLSPPRELTLVFDESAPHERAIAQRLQVKLQPLGYRLALEAAPAGTFPLRAPARDQLFLRSVALPPTPTGALLLWLGLSGQRERARAVLQQLEGAADVDAKARELAAQLGPELPLVPLVTRGLGVTAAKDVQHLTRDVLGLPRLDDAFFSVE